MVTTLGTILGTSLGTELGSMQDVAGFDTRFLYALSNFSGANWYETSTSGGEPGIATGFGFIVLCRLWQNVATTTRAISDNFYTGPVEGWTLNSTGTNTGVQAAFVSGAAASIGTPVIPLTPSDNGRILTLVGQHTGAGALARLSVFRGTYQTSAVTGYTPSARKTGIGKRANVGNIPADGVEVLAKIAFRGVPTDAELNAYIDAVRALGDLPRTPIGSTPLTHRWSLRDYLAGLDLPVTSGQVAPASLPDTVTAAAVDAMARQGSPTVVSIDQSTDGRKTYGALGFSTSARLQSPAGTANTPTLSVELVVTFSTALASTKHILSNADGSGPVGGFSLYQSANTLNLYSYGAGAVVAQTTIPGTDIGYPRRVKFEFTGTVWRLYLDGVQQGADNAGIHTPSTRVLVVGAFGDGTNPADNVSVHSLRVGSYASPNLHFYDLAQDIVANGGPDNGIPTQVLDRIGTDHLTRVGGLKVDTGNTISGFSAVGDYIQTLAGQGIQGVATGFWASTAVVFIANNVVQMPAHCLVFGSSDRGWAIQANNATLQFFVLNDAGTPTYSISYTLTGADLNVPLHLTGQLSASGQVRLFVNGVQVGADAPMVGTYGPATTTPTRLGLWATSRVLTGRSYGLQGGHADVTAAEILTSAQAFQATGQLAAIPGKTHKQWSLPLDVVAAGGKVPLIVAERIAGAEPMRLSTSALQVAQRVEKLWSYEAA